MTEKKKQEVKEAVKTLFAVMKSRKKARDIMTRKVRAIVDVKTLLICCPKLNVTTGRCLAREDLEQWRLDCDGFENII